MPRERRVVEPGGYYHVVSRGNNKQPIFDADLRALFLLQLARITRRFGLKVVAWALMTNHFHLVLRLAEGGLSEGMHELNTGFARASNARFGRINHCLGRRFWSVHIDTESHLLATIRYVMWNPVRAGAARHPADSSWTSFRAGAGLDWAPSCLALPELLGLFGSNPKAAHSAFERFVSETDPAGDVT